VLHGGFQDKRLHRYASDLVELRRQLADLSVRRAASAAVATMSQVHSKRHSIVYICVIAIFEDLTSEDMLSQSGDSWSLLSFGLEPASLFLCFSIVGLI